jgi:tripartite-type tricarboxylate transporter receptor subunit TctC
VKNPEQMQILKLILTTQELARPFAAPPGIPADRKTILLDAFAKLVKDKAFLTDAKKAGLEVDGPMTGAEVVKTVEQIYATPKDVVEKVAKAMQ